MKFFALRHGKAGDGYPDELRELTERGRGDVSDVVARHKDELKNVSLILHSPLVRAQQTAEIVFRQLESSPRVEESPLIRPGSNVEMFADYLASAAEEILICTHNPFVAELVHYLSGKPGLMPTAAMAALEITNASRSSAQLLWLETP